MKVSLIVFHAFLFGWLATSHAERILALFTICSGSHKVAFMPIAEALAAKGHQVTVVSPFAPKKKIDNIREIVVDGAWDKELHIDWFKIADQNPVLSVLNSIKEYREITANGYKTIMNNEEIQEIFRSQSVDLVILSAGEWFQLDEFFFIY